MGLSEGFVLLLLWVSTHGRRLCTPCDMPSHSSPDWLLLTNSEEDHHGVSPSLGVASEKQHKRKWLTTGPFPGLY